MQKERERERERIVITEGGKCGGGDPELHSACYLQQRLQACVALLRNSVPNLEILAPNTRKRVQGTVDFSCCKLLSN
jgi:hypothetical protein